MRLRQLQPLFPLWMAATFSRWLIKHPLRSGSHGGWCNLSSGSSVMECGRLQSLSLGVINSTVESECWKVTERGLFTSKNQSKPVCYWSHGRHGFHCDWKHTGTPSCLQSGLYCYFCHFKRKLAPWKSCVFCVFSWWIVNFQLLLGGTLVLLSARRRPTFTR